MRDVNSACRACDLGQFDDFFGFRKCRRNVKKTSADAERTILHRDPDKPAHRFELGDGRCAILAPENRFSNRSVADERSEVRYKTRCADLVQHWPQWQR